MSFPSGVTGFNPKHRVSSAVWCDLGGISKHEAVAQALFLGPVGVASGASSVERVLFCGGFLEASRSRWTPLGQRLQGGAESEELG